MQRAIDAWRSIAERSRYDAHVIVQENDDVWLCVSTDIAYRDGRWGPHIVLRSDEFEGVNDQAIVKDIEVRYNELIAAGPPED